MESFLQKTKIYISLRPETAFVQAVITGLPLVCMIAANSAQTRVVKLNMEQHRVRTLFSPFVCKVLQA